MKILVTGGPVHAKLDAVKFVTNRFRGKRELDEIAFVEEVDHEKCTIHTRGDTMTIDDALGIECKVKRDFHEHELWYADATKLPGSPPAGQGKTECEAKYDLLAKLMFSRITASGEGYGPIIDKLCREALI